MNVVSVEVSLAGSRDARGEWNKPLVAELLDASLGAGASAGFRAGFGAGLCSGTALL